MKDLPKTFVAGWHFISAVGMFLLLFSLIFLLNSCNTEYRLSEEFDGENLNAVPLQSPAPTPPADNTLWTQQFLMPKVVDRPSGGRWVSIQPKQNYIGRNYAAALSAFSDYFKSNGKNIRGHLSLRLIGSGHVIIGLKASQNANLQGSSLGGYSIRNDITSDIAYLNSNQLASVLEQQQYFGPQGFGIFLSPYKQGNTVELSWSIDQASRVLSLSVSPGGANNQVVFPASVQGISNTPLQRIFLTIIVIDFTMNTTMFVDDISIEEEM
ncbi:MAG: hypothetical protein C0490_09580 [Marivirga sp.]|nr:hypothetical protein [Marivirga sp.]